MEQKGEPTKINRRKFLKAAALVAATAGLTYTGLNALAPKAETPPPKPKVPTPSPSPSPTLTKPQETEVRKETPAPLLLAGELFVNCSPSEKEEARRQAEKQIEHYRKDPGVKQRTEDSKRWQKTVEAVAKEMGFKPNSFVPPLLASLIFVESSGNPQAENPIAKGLCQLRWTTALEEAKRQGISLTAENLFNPQINIKLALGVLHQLYQRFPDPSLTFWAYHLGELNLTRAIKAHLLSQGKKEEVINTILEEIKEFGTKRLVEENHLNFIKLISSPAVVEELKKYEAFGDDTELYVPRIAAARFFLTG